MTTTLSSPRRDRPARRRRDGVAPRAPGRFTLALVLIGRLPTAMVALALLAAVGAGESAGRAGLAAAAVSLAFALAQPLHGRLADRGATVTLLTVTGLAYPVAIAALALAATHQVATGLLLAAAAAAGATTPPIAPLLRAALPRLVSRDNRSTAFALEAAATEGVWIIGPLLVAAAVAAAGPPLALALAAVSATVGAFAGRELLAPPAGSGTGGTAVDGPPVRRAGSRRTRWREVVAAHSGLLVVWGNDALTGTAVAIQIVSVAVLAERAGAGAASGVLVALWSVGSLVGGLLVGAATRLRRRLATGGGARRYAVLLAALAAATVPVALVRHPAALVVALVISGLPLAPVIAASNALIAELAPPRLRTSAFAWSAATVGLSGAVGTGLGGIVIGASAPRVAMLVAVGLLGTASLVAVVARPLLTRA